METKPRSRLINLIALLLSSAAVVALAIAILAPESPFRQQAESTVEAEPSGEAPTDAPTDSPPTEQPTSEAAVTHELVPTTLSEIRMMDALTGWGIAESNTGRVLVRTEDGGQSWRDVGPDESFGSSRDSYLLTSYIDAMSVRIVPPRGNTVWITDDGGATWIEGTCEGCNGDYHGKMTFADPMHGWILHSYKLDGAGEPVTVFRTFDGGLTWEIAADGQTEDSVLWPCMKNAIRFLNPKTGWITAQCARGGPRLYTTPDGGSTWTLAELPAPESNPDLFSNAECGTYFPHFFTPETGVVLVGCTLPSSYYDFSGWVYTTLDAGQTWNMTLYPVTTVQDRSYSGLRNPLMMLDASTGWAFDVESYFTIDGGATWEALGTLPWEGDQYTSAFSYTFADASTGWVIVSDNNFNLTLYHTVDKGRTWSIIQPVLIE